VIKIVQEPMQESNKWQYNQLKFEEMEYMIMGIDVGNIDSAYVILNDDLSIKEFGKIPNQEMLSTIYAACCYGKVKVAIEMIASYGMSVGATIFETCLWVGRFTQVASDYGEVTYIYRKDEKMNLCYTMKAKDTNIRTALIDRFAKHDLKNGKGTKKNPDVFYGFYKDCWAAMAVAVTYHDMYVGGINE
jgi:hypothetical protein